MKVKRTLIKGLIKVEYHGQVWYEVENFNERFKHELHFTNTELISSRGNNRGYSQEVLRQVVGRDTHSG